MYLIGRTTPKTLVSKATQAKIKLIRDIKVGSVTPTRTLIPFNQENFLKEARKAWKKKLKE